MQANNTETDAANFPRVSVHKNTIWAITSENVPFNMGAQWRFRTAYAFA